MSKSSNATRNIFLLLTLAIVTASVTISFVVTAQDMTMTGSTSQSEQSDLSGTYTGVVNYADGSMSGDATLTITGNQFTLESGGTTATGRITAVTTRGYTAVTMRFGEGTESTTPVPTISLRARRAGDRLTLSTVRGETRQFSFAPAGGRTARRRGRRNMNAGMEMNSNMSGDASMNSNTDMQGNANMSGDMNMNGNMSGEMNSNMEMNSNTDMQGNMNGNMSGNMNSNRGRRPRSRRNRNTNSNMNSNMDMQDNMNSNMSGDMNSNMSGEMNSNMGNMNSNMDMTGENMNGNMSGNMNGNTNSNRRGRRGNRNMNSNMNSSNMNGNMTTP